MQLRNTAILLGTGLMLGATLWGCETPGPASVGAPATQEPATPAAPVATEVTARAGDDRVVAPGAAVTLDGAASLAGPGAWVQWRQVSGPPVTLDGADGPAPTFVAPMANVTLGFVLTVASDGRSAEDEVVVDVRNAAPEARIAPVAPATAGSQVLLDGSASSDADGHALAFAWRQTGGAPVQLDVTGASARFLASAHGTLAFELVVDDGIEPSAAATVSVAVENTPPVAVAGAPQTAPAGAQVLLDGRGSSDADGDALTYMWAVLQADPPVEITLTESTTATPRFIAPATRSTITFALTVADGVATSAPDHVVVTIENHAPVADAGDDRIVAHGGTVVLDGSRSSDRDGDPLAWHWNQVEGPAVLLSDPEAASPSFIAPSSRAMLRFELTASDGLATSAPDAVVVHVDNTPPTADAGLTRTVASSEPVPLDGTASRDADGDPLTFSWTQVAGPTVFVADPTAATPVFVAPSGKAAIAFSLVVHDGIAPSQPARVWVHVDNAPPVVRVTQPLLADAGAAVTLDASASTDPDGDALAYTWTQTAGPAVQLAGTGATRSFVAPAGRSRLLFEVSASDGVATTAPTPVVVHVANHPPALILDSARLVASGEAFQLDASGASDADADPLTTSWRQVAGPVVLDGTATQPIVTLVAPAGPAALVFEAVVDDGVAQSAPARVTVHIDNAPPVARVALPLLQTGGGPTVLDGAASSDPDGDALTYEWTQTAGALAPLTANGPTAQVLVPSVPDMLVFSLRVSDGIAWSDPATVVVHAANQPPVAQLAAEQFVPGGISVALDGLASNDPDGIVVGWMWRQVAGPAVMLSSAYEASPTFIAPVGRSLIEFELVVSDGIGDSAPATTRVHVDNHPPVAHAQAPAVVPQGGLTQLDGTPSVDPDGDGLIWSWLQVSGPPVTLTAANDARPSFVAPQAKVALGFELVVSDGVVSSAPVSVSVATANSVPVATVVGPTLVPGGAEVALDASGSADGDGEPLSFTWTQVAGTVVALAGADGPELTFTAPATKGDLVFELHVSDGEDASPVLTHVVSVANNVPVADAGPDREVDGGAQVVLNGSGSSDPDGDVLTHTWTQLWGPKVTQGPLVQKSLSFVAPPIEGEIAFKLVVFDGETHSDPATVRITVRNSPPLASAGPPQAVEPGDLVLLDGSGSVDLDGDPMVPTWTQVEGPLAALSGADTLTPSFTAPASKGPLRFELVVSDGVEISAPSLTTVTVVNMAPLALVSAPQSLEPGAPFTLDASSSADPNGDDLAFAWTQTAGAPVPLQSADVAAITATVPPMKGTLAFRVVVSDDEGASVASDVSIAIPDRPPVADAGPNTSVASVSTVTLDGSASKDPNGDALTYSWTQVSGPSVTLSGASTATPTFFAPAGVHTLMFQLGVGDGIHLSLDTVTIQVENVPPVASAGMDQEVDGGTQVTLDASGSSDPEGSALTFQWTQTEGNPVALTNPSSATPTFFAPATAQTLRFQVSVSDGSLADTDAVLVTVRNHPPLADAGDDQITDGGTEVVLDGSGSTDVDGHPLTWAWTQVSGPSVPVEGADTVSPRFVAPPVRSTLVFSLVVSDGQSESEPAEVAVTVKNNPPVADAGPDRTVAPGAVITLEGAGQDPDGDDLTFVWRQVSGPAVVLPADGSPIPQLAGPVIEGDVTLELVVDDGQTSSAPDTVRIHVGNNSPVAVAAEAMDVQGGALVTLDGTRSFDVDAEPLAYEWQQLAGQPVTLSAASTARATFVAPPGAGLLFQLTVRDPDGAEAIAAVVVSVDNSTPRAEAGMDQDASPSDLVTLDAGGTFDLDGDALSFYWEQVAGPPVTLSDVTSDRPTFTAPAGRSRLTFQAIACDGTVCSGTSRTHVDVQNQPPVVAAPALQYLAAGQQVTLVAPEASDADGDTLTWTWRQTAGTPVLLDDPHAAAPAFRSPQAGQRLHFEVTVSDGIAAAAPVPVVAVVGYRPPMVVVGPDRVAQSGDHVVLDGSGSYDPDRGFLTLSWSQVAGPKVTLDAPFSSRPAFVAPETKGALVFELLAIDPHGEASAGAVTVVVPNHPPVAQAGPAQAVSPGAFVTLTAAGTTDQDGDAISLEWLQVSGPVVELSDPHAPSPTFVAPSVRCSVIFELVATDGDADSEPVHAVVDVQNSRPTADAGPDLQASPGELVQLSADIEDADGDAVVAAWTQTAGEPVDLVQLSGGVAVFTAPATPQILRFQVHAHDGLGLSDGDEIAVVVGNLAPQLELPPSVSVDGGKAVSLQASAIDPNGDAVTFNWQQIAGNAAILSGAATDHLSVTTPATAQTLWFRVTATDVHGAAQSGEVAVEIRNRAPLALATAPSDVSGADWVILDATASADPDGQPLRYEWIQTAGDPVTFADNALRKVGFRAPARRQTLVFSLRVTDGMAISLPATVVVHVRNNAPVAVAGPDLCVAPGATVSLDGLDSSDADGDGLAFAWSQIDGPAAGLIAADTAVPTVTAPPTAGASLAFVLVVSDATVAGTPDVVQVRVSASCP